MNGRTVTRIALVLLLAWPASLSGQVERPAERVRAEVISAVLTHFLGQKVRGLPETGAVVDTTRYVKRFNELRFETAATAWSEAERAAMIDAAAAQDFSVRPCGPNCGDLGSNNQITVGVPRLHEDDRASVLIEFRDTGGRTVYDLDLERGESGWVITDRRFEVATDWIPCDEDCRRRISADSTRAGPYPQ